MTSPDVSHDGLRPQPPSLQIPKSRSASAQASVHRSNSVPSTASAPGPSSDASRGRPSVGASISEEVYDGLNRSPMLSPDVPNSGLHRIRQNPALSRKPSLTNLHSSPQLSPQVSRKSSLAQISGVNSPILPFSEDLTRFPSESLHSFSFAHQGADSLQRRQDVLRRSIDFMRDKISWASSSPRIATAQARLTGDEELLSMMELLQKANLVGRVGEEPSAVEKLGMDRGPLTGPADLGDGNMFETSFLGRESSITEEPEKEKGVEGLRAPGTGELQSTSAPAHLDGEETIQLERNGRVDASLAAPPPPSPKRSSLKRTYTDVAGYSLQSRLHDAMAQPYNVNKSSNMPQTTLSPNTPSAPLALHSRTPGRGNTIPNGNSNDRAPHGHRNNQAQAIFTTSAESPYTITAANDLACLVFGVTRAEVRKLGIMEVISEGARGWLEEKLKAESGSGLHEYSGNAAKAFTPSAGGKDSRRASSGASPAGLAGLGNGITAKLLSKPNSRQSSSSSAGQRRSKTDVSPASKPIPHHPSHKSRGVLLCGDVVSIRKMDGAIGSASIWVKEKASNLIWVLEEIAEDVAYVSVDEIGSVLRGSGAVEAIWGLERLRNGMDIQRLMPGLSKVRGSNTGALDYAAMHRLRHYTARTSNSISIPVTVEQILGQEMGRLRVSSFPHIAGILVLEPQSMKVRSSNSVFASALFGHGVVDGLSITDLVPGFDAILKVMTEEDGVMLEDGMVIPEHSFRRARALLALREGSADATAAVFLRPGGLPARHRDGSEIMVDVQMKVVTSGQSGIPDESTILEEDEQAEGGNGVVYALWVTYSRQLHAVNHGVGPVVTPMFSRPATPPQQPQPGSRGHVESVAPSPLVVAEGREEDELRTQLLTHQLEEAKALQGAPTAEPETAGGEPYEHPSPDMVSAGCAVTKKKRIDDFVILEEMGQGAYGQVKLARYKKGGIKGKKTVIKYVTKRRILVDTWHRDRRLGTVPLEIHVLDYLRREGMVHPCIVEMADFFEDDANYYIEMRPHGLPGMDLFDYIELRVGTMDEDECRRLFRQVADALAWLHKRARVVHRDIKDENVVLDGEGRVKLVDFGSAAYVKNGPFDVFVGTIDYAAPEVLRGSPYAGPPQDVWALGILLYTIVYKENPFYSIDEIMDQDLRVPWVWPGEGTDEANEGGDAGTDESGEKYEGGCVALIRGMLERETSRRLGIEEVVGHAWTRFGEAEEGNGAKAARAAIEEKGKGS